MDRTGYIISRWHESLKITKSSCTNSTSGSSPWDSADNEPPIKSNCGLVEDQVRWVGIIDHRSEAMPCIAISTD